MVDQIRVIDSHTAGEPTRVIVEGGPVLAAGSLATQRDQFAAEFDHFRTAVVKEPRGSDVLVGAMLCRPTQTDCLAGVIFFNNIGFLGMCGHGMIGVVETLRHLGKIGQGRHRIETPVGIVNVNLEPDGAVTIENVPSYRKACEVRFDVDGVGEVVGDVAWGGNWFFLTRKPSARIRLDDVGHLQDVASRIRRAVNHGGYPEVDHVELFDEPLHQGSDSRNFVLCPGLEFDRSPCGTGTSAKMACLAADGMLEPGQLWTQEGILGTRFTGRFVWSDRDAGEISPSVTGVAHVTAESTLVLSERDPFRWGISDVISNEPDQ